MAEAPEITIKLRESAEPPYDCENEAVYLAEAASSWKGDWVDFAELAENVLRAAYAAGTRGRPIVP